MTIKKAVADQQCSLLNGTESKLVHHSVGLQYSSVLYQVYLLHDVFCFCFPGHGTRLLNTNRLKTNDRVVVFKSVKQSYLKLQFHGLV